MTRRRVKGGVGIKAHDKSLHAIKAKSSENVGHGFLTQPIRVTLDHDRIGDAKSNAAVHRDDTQDDSILYMFETPQDFERHENVHDAVSYLSLYLTSSRS